MLLSKKLCSSLMIFRHFTIFEGSTITLSIKYIGYSFFVMLISCILSIYSSKLLISQLRILLV